MHHARLKRAFEESGLSRKQFAVKAQVSEKTIKRILDNPDYNADWATMNLITAALNISMVELFAETDVVLIRKESLAEMEEKIASLENTIASLQNDLKHKDEIIAQHESYKSLLSELARIITCRSTDTQ